MIEYLLIDIIGLGSSGQQLFGVNYPRLQSLKKIYDPKNVFGKGPNLLV